MGRRGRPGTGGRWVAVVALAGGLAVVPTAADAAAVVVCGGGDAHVVTISHTKVDGDLRVAPGTLCELDHVVVTGRLVVPPPVVYRDSTQARLAASEVKGATEVVGPATAIDADRSTLHDVQLDGTRSIRLRSATVRGDVRGTVDVVDAVGARVTGDLEVRGADPALGWATFVDVEVGGDLATSGMLTTADRLVVSGDARIVSPPADPRPGPGANAARICASRVAGELRVARAHDIVAIGAHPDRDAWACPEEPEVPSEPNVVGVLSLVDNYHSIAVANTVVLGDLRCYGNSGPRGVDASEAPVGGVRRGQCA